MILSSQELNDDTIIAYAWSYNENTDILLYWQEDDFEEKCIGVLNLLDPIRYSDNLYAPEQVKNLFSKIVGAMKMASEV